MRLRYLNFRFFFTTFEDALEVWKLRDLNLRSFYLQGCLFCGSYLRENN